MMKNMDFMEALGLLESASELFQELQDVVSEDQREAIDAWLDQLEGDEDD